MQLFHRTLLPDHEFIFHIRGPWLEALNPELMTKGCRAVTAACLLFGKQYYIGIALCNCRDGFNKKIGRAMAVGRAKKLAGQGKCTSFCTGEIVGSGHLWLYKTVKAIVEDTVGALHLARWESEQ